MKKLLLLYGHALSHHALHTLLQNDLRLQLLYEVPTVREAIHLIHQQPLDAIILDISAPNQNGLEVLCDLKHAAPGLPILVINGSERPDRMIHFIRLGCQGYLPYTTQSSQVIPAIRSIARGKSCLMPRHHQLLTESQPMRHEQLSLRELQVLFKLIKGQPVNAVADELDIAPGSVSVFRAKILRKMGVTNNAALIRYALTHGLIPAPTTLSRQTCRHPDQGRKMIAAADRLATVF